MIARQSILSVLLLLPALVAGELQASEQGVIVEEVSKDLESARAGIQAGDVILSWARDNRKGEIASPFDLSIVETEQSPQGQVILEGLRGSEKKSWTLITSRWGIKVRPRMSDALSSVYDHAREMTNAGKLAEAAENWKAAAGQTKGSTAAWFFYQAAGMWADARNWEATDKAYQDAINAAADTGPTVRAQLFLAWADVYRNRNDWKNAETYYQRSIAESQNISAENLTIAKDLNNLGAVARRRGDLAKAEEYHQRALEISQKLAPGGLEVAASFSNLGLVAWNRGDLAKAEDYQHPALEIRQKLAPNSLELANSLNALGLVAWNRGTLEKAEEYHLLALQIRQRLAPDSLDVAGSFNNLGAVAKDRGDLAKAEEYYLKTLEIRQKLAPGSLDLAGCFSNLGTVAAGRGDLAKAEDYYQRALDIAQKLAPEGLETYTGLLNLGVVAINRADLTRAEGYYLQALQLVEKLAPGSLDVAMNLSNLGVVSFQQKDLTKAEEYYRQALEIREKLAPSSLDVAASFNNLGNVAWSRKDFAKAEEYYRQALTIHQKLAPESVTAAEIYRNLADVARDQNDLAGAEKNYRQALSIRSKLAPTSTDYAEALASLAGIFRRQGQTDSAGQMYEQALNAFEGQNSQLGGAEETRSNFRAAHSTYFVDYIELLMLEKKPDVAFHVSERWRARSMLETLAAAQVDLRQGVDPELGARERSLQQILKADSDRRIELLTGEHTEKQITDLEKKISDDRNQYDDLRSRIRTTSPVYAALTYPQPLSATETQRLLDEDTVLLDYVLGEERSYAWVITQDSLEGFELPPRHKIEDLARRLHNLVSTLHGAALPNGEIEAAKRQRLKTAASALSHMVLAPLAARMTGKRLLIISDGALQYVPFAVLPVPGSRNGVPLFVQHEIVYAPSASVLAELRREAMGRAPAPKSVVVLADPVFDKNDPRVDRIHRQPGTASDHTDTSPNDRLTRSVADVGLGHLSRLAYSRREADAIMKATPVGLGKEAVGFEANRATATSQELSQYRIVHFATHALSDSRRPELSGLVLSLVDRQGKSQNGFLDLQDLFNLRVRADLVVLSACETALGKEIRGEGLIGLTRGFMYAGATRVLASLWKVDDVATAELMARFYRAMEQQGLRPAAALRRAQIDMWRQKRWAAPYYWAGFQLQGEWK